MRRAGFTLVEIVVALVILGVGVLGLSVTAGRLTVVSGNAEAEALALQAVADRLSLFEGHGRYADLEATYEGVETELDGLPGSTRTTSVSRVRTVDEDGGVVDRTHVTVTVEAPGLSRPVTRSSIVGAP